nr:putative ribonuclease H-like domain-containing protein [Tanacetum cinerariifolium]
MLGLSQSSRHPKRNFVPRAVLMTSGFKTLNTARQNSSRAVVSVNTAREINTAYPRPIVNSARLVSYVFNIAHSHDRRPFNKFTANKDNNFNEKVNIVTGNITAAGQRAYASITLKKFDYVDVQGRSMSYEEIDGGYVAFGGDPKGGKITSKGKISLDTESVVLSPDFKLLDESQVLLRVPIKNNMYSVDLKNVASSGCLTFLFAKATLDESNLWHKRRRHIKFKLINKLVKENLVRGIENLKDLRVKLIRCDNETEFKIKVMNQFYEMKEEEEKKDTEGPGYEESKAPITEELKVNQEKDNLNSTNRVNAINLTINAASNEVNVMDMKSAFPYGKIKEEVYVYQSLRFEDPEFPDRVYKVEKALYGLHQAPKACQDKYVDEILKKFSFSTMKTASTLMDTSKPLMKDENAKDILEGQPKLGLWYPKDSPFDLEVYTDSDYTSASLDRKSTTGGCQFPRNILISRQCKKKTVVSNSTFEAEYVATANCCGHVLWIQNQMLDYRYNFMNTKIFINNESTICIVKNPVFHSKTMHIKIRHHFIKDLYEKSLIQVIKIHIVKPT